MPQLHAHRFVLEFAMPTPIALRALCDDRGYDKPTETKPYAAKTYPDGSTITILKDEQRGRVVVAWDGAIEDYGALRFAIDGLYADLAAIGVTAVPECVS